MAGTATHNPNYYLLVIVKPGFSLLVKTLARLHKLAKDYLYKAVTERPEI
jgi:hypothetical protein